MLEFFKKYLQIFMLFPVMIVIGMRVEPAAYLMMLGAFAFWHLRGKPHHLIICFIWILMLSDSKFEMVAFVKNLRIVGIMFLTVVTLEAMIRGRYGIKRIFLFSFPFFIVAYLALQGSPVLITGFSKTTSYLLFVFVVLHYFAFYIKRDQEIILMDIAKLIACGYLISFLMGIIAPFETLYAGVAFRGFFGNPNGLGMFCTITLPYILILSTLYPHRKKFLAFVIALCVISVLLAQSRTSMGAMLIFSGLFYLYRHPNKRKYLARFFWYIALPLSIIFIARYGIVNIFIDVGLSKYMRAKTIMKGSGRFFAWTESFNEIKKSIVIGRGFEYERYYFRKNNTFFTDNGHEGNMHNSFMVFLMNTGALGLFFILAFYYALFNRIKGEARRFILPLLIPLILSAMFESWLAASLNTVLIFMYLIILMLTFYRELQYTVHQRRLAAIT